ncbi:MAG: UDP-N-acetylmuramoyl-L-alanyl-D-glutamate--2,6-diaminopimelate ligase [Paludibacteraceae bacterium]|nr:UDP-N-acetylmuramoyl-L-alanyl-D-glutamate--2,6-diaminopimelate ligase [Paludibacteraceae bacterium]
MKLGKLIERIKPLKVVGKNIDEVEVTSVCADSRKVGEGALFIATVGTAVDGHSFIAGCIDNGAVAIVCQKLPSDLSDKCTYVQVADSSEALGLIASAWYGYPSESLTLVGVTGTNGKTTIATLLYKMFLYFGHKAGLLSTVCNYVNLEAVPSTHTTPDPLSLQKLLADMVEAGCEYAFMEVSSHSADQKRIAGIQFDGGIFTNITRDHLDYHKTFDNYIKAKQSFFTSLPKNAFALTNVDDKNGLVMTQCSKANVKTYSVRQIADYKAKIVCDSFEGMELEISNKSVFTQFVGRFNASNLLAVYGACRLLGKEEQETLVALSTMVPVNGRFEAITSPSGYVSIVDYAHTPDALMNVISTINEVKNGDSRLITIVGCGGNRDKGKRPIMAQEAVKASDIVMITSDNPRNEEPMDIINDMLAGLNTEQQKSVMVNPDREQAIKTVMMMAQKGDVVLVAGKGHEDYQEIKGVKHHFDDHEVIRKYMR